MSTPLTTAEIPAPFIVSALVAVLICIFIIRSYETSSYRSLRYPPGPHPLPIVGNIFQFPASRWWLKFTELGPLVHLSVANKHIVLINSQEMAAELLDRTSTADRPLLLMAGELMGFDASIAFIGYGERWRTYRRISNKVMSVSSVKMYSETLAREAIRLVSTLLDDPHSYSEQIRFSLGRTIMEAIYGIDCLSPDDTYIKVAEETLENISHAVIPGSYMVDVIPWHSTEPKVKYLPYIGLPFQRHVRLGRKQLKLMVGRPFQHVLRTRLDGTARPSFTSSILDGEIGLADSSERDDIMSWAAGTMYGGVAHVCRDDIEYKDYHLPKGTILISNVWSISQNSSYYEDPQAFNPDRFLKEHAELDPFNFAFGYGPRICLGRYFAIDQLYIVVASLLWAFVITPLEKESLPHPSYTSGFISAPSPFRCNIAPRHDGVEYLRR
ncbi:hypothetical protein CVT25_013004 [Psilocybe cyanescens]|uniref:Cytochrome P450 n=1 Tax=Psilocybe cyanescens TaxID=93625 RepID=A0A409XHK8_PSICY|nr:hypothetical protein CVT25_013004 [Psilocybe cyanescens]